MPAPKKPTNNSHSVVEPLMLLYPNALATNEYDLLIYGQIGESWWDEESVTAKSVVDQLSALPDSITQINVRINSIGGSVHDGLAIYNALKRHPATIAVAVDGVAMSAASFIAMAGDTVSTPATSVWMIHGPSTFAGGNALELRAVASALDVYASSMAPAYATKSGKSVDDVLALLNDGADHYYTGDQAVAEGFADAVVDVLEDPSGPLPAEARASLLSCVTGRVASAPANIRQMAIAAIGRLPDATAVAPHPLTVISAAPTAINPGAMNMPNANTTATPVDPAADAAAITAQAHAVLRTRNTDILAVVQPYLLRDGVQAIYTAALADPEASVDGVRAQVLDKIGASTMPIAGNATFEAGADEADKFRAAGENAILSRAGQVKADGQNPLRGFRLIEIARASLERGNATRRGMDSMDVVASAFTTTSDFPALLTSAARASLLRGYDESPETFDQWTRAGTLTDFREASKAGLGFFSDLDKIPEDGEYKYGKFGSAGQSMILATYGKMFSITRQAIINDDLGAFTSVPQKMGRAAKRTIGNLVYAILNNNPKLVDNVALFHATHNNLAAGGGINSATVGALRRLLMAQKVEGLSVNIPLKYLLVPSELEDDALLVRDNSLAVMADGSVSSNANTQRNRFEVVSDGRMNAGAWFGAADPNLFDTVEVDYLDGIQTPFLDQKDGWTIDGTEYKVRLDAGVAPLDFRGLAKNPGV